MFLKYKQLAQLKVYKQGQPYAVWCIIYIFLMVNIMHNQVPITEEMMPIAACSVYHFILFNLNDFEK